MPAIGNRGGLCSRCTVPAVVIVAVAVGAATTLRAFRLRSSALQAQREAERQVARAIDEGQRAFRSVTTAPLSSLASVDALRDHLLSLVGPLGSDAAAAPALLGQVAEVIYFRFLQDSPGAYRRWREGAGYRMRDPASMRREGVATDYEYWFKEPYPGDERVDDVFDRLWTATLRLRNEASRPVAIASDGGGVAIAFATMDRAEQSPAPVLSGAVPAEHWEGRQQVALSRNWWVDANGGLLEERRRTWTVPIAIVGVILEMKAGDRYPFSFSFYQDSEGRWWLWRVNVQNVDEDRLVQLEF